ncbi:hypothetical protein [Vibrio breoganii]|uniref:hypothetical protein n=1 Tax=Vibrio breoganii TaxID=553239 RepID=UPI000C821ED0|nr:hypothetical protein [Vibrio breoganii]PMG89964.1 hypothetical protein BCU79_18210 [Vibrio breoganii]PMJ48018.1 hypothetical protein BCU21_04900 [Vibrio breoganii]PMK57708.1 hypothetical protein BCT97_09965 [Vibrio breoganii]PMM79568.1 hypothetical protein BCT44_15005 [Vibrio breoganii]PMO27172.1 hypothetical protein BCT14_13475 [Vibrio breoganii]
MSKKRVDRLSVFAECDAVVKDLPNEKITSRLIGTRMGVTQTAVYKLVKQWHEEEKQKAEELISKTQMSTKFVGALMAEVDTRVAEMRQLDEKERLHLSQEMDEMAEQVGSLEGEIQNLREQLESRTVALATTEQKLEQFINDLATAKDSHTEQITQLEAKHQSASEALTEQHISAMTKAEKQAEELDSKLEAKTSELQVMTRDFAKAELKAESFDTVTAELTDLKTQLSELVTESANLKAQRDATAKTIENLESSNADNIEQRNRAQEELAKLSTRLTETQSELQTQSIENVALQSALQDKDALVTNS